MDLEDNKIFPMTWGWQSTLWTLLTIVFIVFIFYLWINECVSNVGGIISIILLLAVILMILWMPLKIKVSTQIISLCRIAGVIKIVRNDITRIERISLEMLTGSFRVGSGGVWGYWGKCHNEKLGWYNLFAMKLNNLVLIETKDFNRYVIGSKELCNILGI